jgi:hypothetical protein
MAIFETGAVRSSDVDDVAFYLISPIGIRRLANVYKLFNRPHNETNQLDLIDIYYDNILYYLSGDRSKDYLSIAAANLCEIIAIDNNWRRPIWDKSSWSNIPPIALKKLAATYHEGKEKYVEYNCELGFPIWDLLNHSMNHVNTYNERHQILSTHPNDLEIPHALWGLITAMHSEEMTPHLNEDNLRSKDNIIGEKLKIRIKKVLTEKEEKKIKEKMNENQLKK